MSGSAEANLKSLGLTLPAPAPPAAAYVPYTICGTVVSISGQLPKSAEGKLTLGQLGAPLTVEEGQAAAALCALHLLAQMKAAAGGDLSNVKKVLMARCYVNSASTFHDHHLVANGFSELIVKVLGEEVGRHARCAFGVAQLPMNCAVEIEAQIELVEPRASL